MAQGALTPPTNPTPCHRDGPQATEVVTSGNSAHVLPSNASRRFWCGGLGEADFDSRCRREACST